MSLYNLTRIGKASLVWSQGKFSLTLNWEQEVPPSRQVDITVFLLELFRDASSRDIQYQREHTRISLVSEHLYGFDIIEVNPTICVVIYSTDESEDLPSINPHDVTLLPYSWQ